MFLLPAGGKSFASKERKERRVFIPLPVSLFRWSGHKLRYNKSLCNKVQFCFAVSENSITFTPEFRRHSGGVRKDFIEKVLLKLSSMFKLRNFDLGMKMIAIAPHRWYVQRYWLFA